VSAFTNLRTSDEIRAALERMQREKDFIADQVSSAKRKAAATRVYSNHEWLTSSEATLRSKGRGIQKLQTLLGAARRQEREERLKLDSASFERVFWLKAREILPRPLYEQVMSETSEAMRVTEEPSK